MLNLTEQRKRIEGLLEMLFKATPGTWEHVHHPGGGDGSYIRAPRLDPSHPYDIEIMQEDRHEKLYPPDQAFADGDFIAAMKNATEDLCALALAALPKIEWVEAEDDPRVMTASWGQWRLYAEGCGWSMYIAPPDCEEFEVADGVDDNAQAAAEAALLKLVRGE